jgi:DNA helicase HerA-like ATPase
MSGSGKTTLLEWFVNQIANKFKNIIVIDPVYRFSQKPSDIKYMGFLQSKYPNIRVLRILDEEQFNKLCKVLNEYNEPVFLVVDEVDRYVSPNFWISRDTVLYFKEGRNWGKGGVFTVQRIGRLNKEILANSQYLFWFKINAKSDIEYLQKILPEDVKQLDHNLNKYEFYIYDLTSSDLLGKFKLDIASFKIKRIG